MTDTPTGAQLPGSPGATGPQHVVSVAELLARHSAGDRDTHDGAGPATGSVLSVGDLLRREGRAPVTSGTTDVSASGTPGPWPDIDLPGPRSTAGADGAQGWPARPTSGRRRAGAVAGALIAAGSVLGAAVYNGAASHESDAQAAADGLFPGIGLPAASGPPDSLPGQYLPANVALSSPIPEQPAPVPDLPATAPGATDWMGVAFPQQSAAAGTLREVSTGGASDAVAAIPAQRTPAPDTGASPSAPSSGTGATGTGSPLGEVPVVQALNDPDRAPAENLVDPLTAPASPGGGDTTGTGPLQDVTESTRPVGNTLAAAVSPVADATGPVGETLGGTVEPVTTAVSPVTDAVKPVTRPLTDTLEPVTTPVVGALSPVTEPVLGATEPLTGPLLDAAEPVTGLLDTSAKKSRKNSSGDASGTSATSGNSETSRKSDDSEESGSSDSSERSRDSEATRPLEAVTGPVGKTLSTATEPVGETVSTVTEPVGGTLGGVTGAAGSLLGGGSD